MKRIKRFIEHWIKFYWGRRFDISFEACGYFDPRPEINIALGFFSLTIKLPFKTKWTDECVPPKWGIGIHSNIIWIYRGGKGNMGGGNKWWTFTLPWQPTWVRTSVLRKDGKWEHELPGKRKDFYKDEWKDVIWKEQHPYRYILKSGTIQDRIATIGVSEREWRWHWFKWLP